MEKNKEAPKSVDKKNYLIYILIIIIILVGWSFGKRFFRGGFNLPSGGDSESISIILDKDGQIVDDATAKEANGGDIDADLEENLRDKSEDSDFKERKEDKVVEKDVEDTKDNFMENKDETTNSEAKILETKEIMVTEGVRHSVPLDEIIGGGPAKDGIPPIDDPKFISISEANDLLDDNEPGIALSFNSISRFYPFQILVWHEIVNDMLGGQRVLVTYCPLCLSGIVFDPVVQGERVEFGTSGKLWQSNLVMYDRKTDSLWSQILGESIVGELTGTRLKVLPSDQMRYGNWKKQNLDGEVLSRDTGAVRFYGRDPYGDYYTTSGTFFPLRNEDNRLEDKDFVLGIVVDGQAKAYLPEAIKKAGEIEDKFAGKTFVVKYESEIDAVRIFEKITDGTLERINPFPNFWFSWVAAHPETELYK